MQTVIGMIVNLVNKIFWFFDSLLQNGKDIRNGYIIKRDDLIDDIDKLVQVDSSKII